MYVSFLSGKIDDSLPLFISLTNIFGIGRSRAMAIMKYMELHTHTKLVDLDQAVKNKLVEFISKTYVTELDLKRQLKSDILTLKETGCLRGRRHTKGFPVRGQRTHSNAVTAKRNKQ